MDSIAVLLPTLNRPAGLKRVLESLRATTPEGTAIMVATDPDDAQAREIAETYEAYHCTCNEARRGPAYGWNTALSAIPHKMIYVLGADDLIFNTGWYETSLKALEYRLNGSGLVGFNDERKNGDEKNATHYLMSRDFIIHYHGGVMAVPHYRSWGVDPETCERARRAGKYYWCKDVSVTHDWHGYDKDADETYRLARPTWNADLELYEKRRVAGFPDDFPAVIR